MQKIAVTLLALLAINSISVKAEWAIFGLWLTSETCSGTASQYSALKYDECFVVTTSSSFVDAKRTDGSVYEVWIDEDTCDGEATA
mmetsp:Transcript_33601/g.30525  ORF Transcript_33601/g.30525 Transcript_33601/m.30525 type:complete len:86 (-) Transcript_33601:539-796(-)